MNPSGRLSPRVRSNSSWSRRAASACVRAGGCGSAARSFLSAAIGGSPGGWVQTPPSVAGPGRPNTDAGRTTDRYGIVGRLNVVVSPLQPVRGAKVIDTTVPVIGRRARSCPSRARPIGRRLDGVHPDAGGELVDVVLRQQRGQPAVDCARVGRPGG